jgi:glycosyltransferase involved in cell wall biosynthesis
MGLVILNVAYPFAPVGPDCVGGAEQIVTQLDAALVRAGHDSIVMACEGSVTHGILVCTPRPEGILTDDIRRKTHELFRRTLEQFLEKWIVDVVHIHGVDFTEYLPPTGVPALVTLHLPLKWYPPQVFQLNRPQTFLHCVSTHQRSTCPAGANLLDEIENGVATELFSSRHAKRNFAVALGRICPEKGFHHALDAAKHAQIPLLLAGETFRYETHENYFQKEIMPRLDRSRRFVGPVGFTRKRRLLSAARCLLAPSLVPETSSLVAMEALACGTPVIAFRSGALADIIEHGRTGFLVSDEREMAEAIRAIDVIDPAICRQIAEKKFCASRMIEKYFAVYERLAGMHQRELEKESEMEAKETEACAA